MIDINICKKVLTVGTDYKNPYGGIAFLLNVYSTFFYPFNFVCTSKKSNKISKFIILLYAIFKFFYYLIFKNIEIIHIHGASYNSFYRKLIFINISYIFKKKIIYHIHGGEFHIFSKNKKIVHNTLHKCTSIIVLSEHWKKFFENNFNLSNVIILNNTCHYPLAKTKNDSANINLLYLGAINQSKGIFDLIDALNILNKEGFKNYFLHIGGQGDIKNLQNVIKKFRLENHITLYGWVNKDLKSELFSQSDIFILPSYNEGMPISILEAMSYNIPIIATNVGGIPEIVKNKYNGLLVEPKNIYGIYKSIKTLILDKELREYMKVNNKKIIIDYLPNKISSKLSSIYKEYI